MKHFVQTVPHKEERKVTDKTSDKITLRKNMRWISNMLSTLIIFAG